MIPYVKRFQRGEAAPMMGAVSRERTDCDFTGVKCIVQRMHAFEENGSWFGVFLRLRHARCLIRRVVFGSAPPHRLHAMDKVLGNDAR